MSGKETPGPRQLSAIRRRSVSTESEAWVKAEPLIPGSKLPLAFQPVVDGMDLVDWAAKNREMLEKRVLEHGALLFRGFDVPSAAYFEQFIGASSLSGAVEYKYRASPRSQVEGNIYTSTDYPPDQWIFPHNEHSFSPVFPLRIFLCCMTPAASGGETPIGDCRMLLDRVTQAGIKDRFLSKGGVMYVRNYNDGFGLPWETVFQTTDKSVVEEHCSAHGIEVEWKTGNRLRTRQQGPVIVKHPRTGESVWFNHGTFFHVTTLPGELRDGVLRTFADEDLPTNTYYGDGTPIEDSVLTELRSAYMDSLVSFPWEKGDVLMVDNVLTVHARNPYTGIRKVVVGMAEPTSWKDVRVV